jgi:HEAT repeat protein
MDDPVPRVRWIAMHALSCHACGEKPGALEAAIRERIMQAVAKDPSPQVRRHAAVALGLAHETGAAPVIEAMLVRETDAKTLRAAGWARDELARPAYSQR